jgi:hypothetical protein
VAVCAVQMQAHVPSASCNALGLSGTLFENRASVPLPQKFERQLHASHRYTSFVPVLTNVNLVGEPAIDIEYALIFVHGEASNPNVS